METEDIDKILSKSYSELNVAERETIQEICGSEEEFLQLQQFFASVENYATEIQENSLPTPETKERLDNLFHQTYQKKGILWYNAVWIAMYPVDKRFDQRPLVRIAAILVLLISIVPFLNNSKMESKTALAKNEAPQKEKTEEKANTYKVEQAETGPENQMSETLSAESSIVDADDQSIYSVPAKAETIKNFGYEFAPAPSTTGYLSEDMVRTYNWTHSDGIYMDTFTYNSDAFTLKENLAVLDLLTPTF